MHTEATEPIVSIALPTSDTALLAAPMTIEAVAAGAGNRAIIKVDYYLGGNLVGTTTTLPHRITITPSNFDLEAGSYELRVVATDNTYSNAQAAKSITLE